MTNVIDFAARRKLSHVSPVQIVRITGLSLWDLAGVLGRGDDPREFYCPNPKCQGDISKRFLHSPAAMFSDVAGWTTTAELRDAYRWACILCSTTGTREDVLRFLLSNASLLQHLEVVA